MSKRKKIPDRDKHALRASRTAKSLGLLLVPLITCMAPAIAQTPATDPHWTVTHSDDFNTLDPTKWQAKHDYDAFADTNFTPLVHVSGPKTAYIDTGNLVIQLNKEDYLCPEVSEDYYGCSYQKFQRDSMHITPVPYSYTSGYVESVYKDFLYGYMEARIKVQYTPRINSAFWTVVKDGLGPYSEIDVFEMIPGKTAFHDNNVASCNVHYRINGIDTMPAEIPWYYGVNDYTQYHKYGVLWTPTRISWFVDDKEVRVAANPGVWKQQKMIFSMGFYDNTLMPSFPSLPSKMYIDWFKFYKLENDCGIAINTCTYNFLTHDNKVKKNIVIGGSSCTNSISSSANLFLRAAEGIEISGDFTIPVGAECLMDVEECY